MLLGVRAVIAESFERIHRSNLIGMGVLPLQFIDGRDAAALGLTGRERYEITGFNGVDAAQAVGGRRPSGQPIRFEVRVRIDTPKEREYFRHGGILPLRAAPARGPEPRRLRLRRARALNTAAWRYSISTAPSRATTRFGHSCGAICGAVRGGCRCAYWRCLQRRGSLLNRDRGAFKGASFTPLLGGAPRPAWSIGRRSS